MNKLGDHIPIKGIVDAKTDQEFKTYYIIYFNLVGSSRPNISLEQQIKKLNDFNDMIYQTINATVFYDNSHPFSQVLPCDSSPLVEFEGAIDFLHCVATSNHHFCGL